MWWDEDWMACSQSLLVLSCVSGGWRLNNVEYTFGNKIIVTRLTDNNRCEITTRLSSLLPRIMKGAHCGDRGVSGFIWNGIWNSHCQVLLASLHDKLEFLEKAAVSANLGVWNICRAILISFQCPSLILLNNVFIMHIFSLNHIFLLGWGGVQGQREGSDYYSIWDTRVLFFYIWCNPSCWI